MLLPPKLLGGLAPAPLHLSSYAYVLKWLKLSDCEKRFRYTASSEDMQIMRTATPNLLLDGILPLCTLYSSTKLRDMLVIVMRGTDS